MLKSEYSQEEMLRLKNCDEQEKSQVVSAGARVGGPTAALSIQ